MTGPLRPGDPIIEADEAYKQRIAIEFQAKLQLEKRRDRLHKLYIVEVSVMGVCMLLGLMSLSSSTSSGTFLVTRNISVVLMGALAVTAVVQIALLIHEKSL
jgi:hypothetical protein